MRHARLAFVDLETSGLSPSVDRIAEIGVVTLDGGASSEYATLLACGSARRRVDPDRVLPGDDADTPRPRFRDIAAHLAGLLAGRLLVAHNARFDYNFLRAEFARAGIAFEARVICSLALSRKLAPQHARHDLDSLAARHRLEASIRHRALPDARLLRALWHALEREHDPRAFAAAIDEMLAAPVYPAGLDRAVVERLPERAGIYVLIDARGAALAAGSAANVKRAIEQYFRIGRASARAFAFSHRVADIRWWCTRGPIGARLRLATHAHAPAAQRARAAEPYCWQLDPCGRPALRIARLDHRVIDDGYSYGVFATARKAHNALVRLALGRTLCFHVMGIAERGAACARCTEEGTRAHCMTRVGALRELTRVLVALTDHHNPVWPFSGPVALRERGELHVLDRWCYLGSAVDAAEVHALVGAARGELDPAQLVLLRRLLKRHARKIIALEPRVPCPRAGTERGASDRVRPGPSHTPPRQTTDAVDAAA